MTSVTQLGRSLVAALSLLGAMTVTRPTSAQVASSQTFSREMQWRCVQATVRLVMQGPNGGGFCSGAVVGHDDRSFFVASAPHCFASGNVQAITVEAFGNSYPQPSRRFSDVEIVLQDAVSEFALLRVRGQFLGPELKICPYNRFPLAGETVLSIGCAHGAAPTPEVNRLVGNNPNHWIVQQHAAQGRSGGPLISAQGFLIGCACCTDGTHSFYSYLDRMHRQLDRAGLASLYGGDAPQVSRSQIRPKPQSPLLPSCPTCPQSPNKDPVASEDEPVLAEHDDFAEEIQPSQGTDIQQDHSVLKRQSVGVGHRTTIVEINGRRWRVDGDDAQVVIRNGELFVNGHKIN